MRDGWAWRAAVVGVVVSWACIAQFWISGNKPDIKQGKLPATSAEGEVFNCIKNTVRMYFLSSGYFPWRVGRYIDLTFEISNAPTLRSQPRTVHEWTWCCDVVSHVVQVKSSLAEWPLDWPISRCYCQQYSAGWVPLRVDMGSSTVQTWEKYSAHHAAMHVLRTLVPDVGTLCFECSLLWGDVV